MAAEMILIRGVAGAGKSTMARALASLGYVHYEADMYFEGDSGYNFRKELIPAAHDWCLAAVTETLIAGGRVVVANTFTRLWEMRPYVERAMALNVPFTILEAHGNWPSVHGVPPLFVENMRERWEPLPADLYEIGG